MSCREARRWGVPTAAVPAACLLALSLALAGCSSGNSTVTLTGRVTDDSIAIQVPAVARVTTATVSALTQTGSYATIKSVEVEAGDRVAAGDVLFAVDVAPLKAAVRQAAASVAVARARVRVLESMSDDLADKKATVADTRAQLTDTISQLESTLADLRDKRALAADALARLRKLLGSLPTMPPGGVIPTGTPPGGGVLPTGTPPGSLPTGTPPGGLPPGLPPGGLPDPAKLEAGIAQLDAAIAKLETGIAKARRGLARLDEASSKVADAQATLADVTELARIAAGASTISVDVARQRLEAAVVRAPVAGVVTQVVSEGEVLAPGAAAVRIRPDGAANVNGYVGEEYLGRIELGDPVVVRIDSRPAQRYRARITRVGEEAVYPPTYVATREVHLGRAVLVEARLEATNVALPAGTPVDLTIAGIEPAPSVK